MVASHTAVPLGTAKWLVRATHTHKTLLICKGQVLTMSPTQGQAYIIGATFAPAISRCLKARLYGWLPLSDASGILFANGPTASSLLTVFVCFLWHPHCKRPNGIFFANYPYLLPLTLKPNNQTTPVLRRPERPTII